MKIKIQIEIHAYAQDKLCDEILDSNLPDTIESCGILGPDIIIPLRKNRNTVYYFQYDENTTLSDIENFIFDRLGVGSAIWIAFLFGGERYKIDNRKANFMNVVEKYLTSEDYDGIRVGVYASLNAGAICCEGQLRYIMHSRERGRHNLPHVHVVNTSYEHEATISILDGEVLSGSLPSKLLKKAKEKILNDNQFFLESWNKLTDGIKVDINKHYELIKY